MTVTLNIKIITINIDMSLKITVTAPAYQNKHPLKAKIANRTPRTWCGASSLWPTTSIFSQGRYQKGWLAIAKLKPLSLFISLLLKLNKELNNSNRGLKVKIEIEE